MNANSNIPSRKEIGDCLQKLRIAAGFDTAKDFAAAVGFNVDTYTGYEQGKGMFSYEKAWIMADALHCSIDALGGRKPPLGYAEPATTEERTLVDDYRRMEDGNKASLMDTAHTFALAAELKKEGDGRHVALVGDDVRNGE